MGLNRYYSADRQVNGCGGDTLSCLFFVYVGTTVPGRQLLSAGTMSGYGYSNKINEPPVSLDIHVILFLIFLGNRVNVSNPI